MTEDTKIIIFGDSITYGAYDEQLGGWVNRLRLALQANTDDFLLVYNLGISGEVSGETLARFETELAPRFDTDDNNIIIFAIGINDTVDVEGRGDRVTIEKFADNIERLIAAAKRYTDNVIFVGLTCVDQAKTANRMSHSLGVCKSYINDKIAKFDNALLEACTHSNITYIPMFDVLEVADLPDGLHPNANGHKKMCDKIMEVLHAKRFI